MGGRTVYAIADFLSPLALPKGSGHLFAAKENPPGLPIRRARESGNAFRLPTTVKRWSAAGKAINWPITGEAVGKARHCNFRFACAASTISPPCYQLVSIGIRSSAVIHLAAPQPSGAQTTITIRSLARQLFRDSWNSSSEAIAFSESG
jgi:hypothetical protein